MEPTNNNYENPQVPPRAPLSTNTTNSPKDSSALTIFFVAIFILLSLGAVAFLYYQNQQLKSMLSAYQISPTPTATPNQKANDSLKDLTTFTSNKYNFSFKYPTKWTADSPDPSNNFDISGDLNLQASTTGPISFNLKVMSTSNTFLATQRESIKSYQWDSLNLTKTTTDGIDTEIFSGLIDQNPTRIALFTKGKYIYIFRTVAWDDLEELNIILSTFKFLDQQASTPIVSNPVPNSKISSPLTITGSVPAGWMFEGGFPIKIVDSKRNLVAQGTAKEVTPGSWQSGKAAAFFVSLPFSSTDTSGYIILSNDNPSGDPANSKTFEIPITF